MGKIFNAIFGGGESKSSSQQSSKPVDLTPPEFQALRQPFADLYKGLVSGGESNPLGGIPSPGPGQGGTAPLGSAEQDLLTQLQQYGAPGGTGAATDTYINDVISGKYLNPNTNPFLDAYIQAAQRQTQQALEQTLGRTLPGQFTAAGQKIQPGSSSAFDRAAALAYGQGANALADIATNIGYNAYTGERTNQQQAVQLGQQQVQTVISNLQAQALPRLIQQYGLDQGLQEFNTRLQTLLQVLGVGAGVGTATPAQTSQGTSNASAYNMTGIYPTTAGMFSFGF
jgi:hypothetical protein